MAVKVSDEMSLHDWWDVHGYQLTAWNLAQFEYTWNLAGESTDASGVISWQSVDLLVRGTWHSAGFAAGSDTRLLIQASTKQEQTQESSLGIQDLNSPAALQFIIDCLAAAGRQQHGSLVRLVVPLSRGYIVRSDILPLRLIDCSLASLAIGLATPLQFFSGEPIRNDTLQGASSIQAVFSASCGAILLNEHTPIALKSLDAELYSRLSFPWISMRPPQRKVLALVEGGRRSPDLGGNGETVFTAAHALGIDMVVLDNPGHWLEGPRWESWRKAFLPIECTLQSDAVFTRRVVDAITAWGGHLDGIVTFCDHYREPVAEAARLLGLPTCEPAAYALATDKFRLRRFEGRQAYRATRVEEASAILKENSLEFPLIVKPCTGYLSEGVARVDELSQLEPAIRSIHVERHGPDFAIEEYCEGPEVDANFVLADGELLFFEASDEVPKGADVNSYGNVNSFIELANILPSNLPGAELSLLRDSLYQSLLGIGFQDGIYHLEARVQHSAVEYAMKDGVFDLFPRAHGDEEIQRKKPSAWLIEVNPRPAGIQASDASKRTYGIDYWGLGLLFGLGDTQRVRQLSHPFAQGAQYFCEMVFIPVEKGGIFQSADVCEELFERRPDIAECVSWSICFFSEGDEVPDPASGVNAWVAHFNVFSRTSRAHVLELAELLRKEVRFAII